jgi:deoxyribodipyrimidine photo-lyase
MLFPVTREGGWKRWEEFKPQAVIYGVERNHVRVGHENVSRLSPALRYRLILETELVAAALQVWPLETIEKFIQEIYWRRYWKSWLETRPQVWNRYRLELRRWRENMTAEKTDRCHAVEVGRGGIGVMDYFARELVETGYLHNHARMWFASYWIHVEKLPWEVGADFFYRHLLDADPASNTLSWRWVAGLQTKGKTYLVNRANVEKYCDLHIRSDVRGLERLEEGKVKAAILFEDKQPVKEMAYFQDEVQGLPERVGLWIHGEDLCLENSPLAQIKPVAIVAVTSLTMMTRLGLSPLQVSYQKQALQDGLQRAGRHYGIETELRQGAYLGRELGEWAAVHRLEVLVAMVPMVGPLRDEMESAGAALQEVGTRLVFYQRAEDATCFSETMHGFFPFWEKIKSRLCDDFPPKKSVPLDPTGENGIYEGSSSRKSRRP